MKGISLMKEIVDEIPTGISLTNGMCDMTLSMCVTRLTSS